MESIPVSRKTARLGRELGLLLAIAALVALPLRCGVYARSAMLSRDGAVFIQYSRSLQDHPLQTLRDEAHHPLYPASILLMHQTVLAGVSDPVLRWDLAGVGAAMMAGLLLVIASYILGSVLFSRRVGLWAALLTACCAEFCQLSADALSDMLHLALYLFAAAAGVRLVQSQRWTWAMSAGALSGLAYLTRPEGGEVALVLLLVLLPARVRWKRKIALLALVVVGFFAVASPYMMTTGKLVQKKSLIQFIPGMDEAAAGPAPAATAQVLAHFPMAELVDLARMAAVLLENYFRSLRITFFLPVIVWLTQRQHYPASGKSSRFIAALMVFHVVVLFALIIRFRYMQDVSLRHVFILTGLTLPYAAAGIVVLLDAIQANRRRLAGFVLLIVLVTPTLPWMFEARHTDEAYLRRGGEWLRRHAGDRQRIMTTRIRVSHYAHGVLLPASPGIDTRWILGQARKQEADWLAFDTHRKLSQDPAFFTRLEADARPGESLERVHVEDGETPDRSLIIYRYRYPP